MPFQNIQFQDQEKGKAWPLCGLALGISVCLVWLAGCATSPSPPAAAASLAERLRAIDSQVDPSEATLAAETAYSYSLELAKEYRVVHPAILHNVFVNVGLRERGLCFQWADDLAAKLQSLRFKTLVIRRGVARLDTRREHSSVVVTAPGQAFDQGIVLDAWRYSGRLYWGGVKTDHYPWMEVEVIPVTEVRGPVPSRVGR